MKVVLALTAVLLLTLGAAGADREPYLESAPMPFYPRLAGQARIAGKVSVRFTVNDQGDTSEVEAVTGHPLLREAAIQNVKNWKFGWVRRCGCRAKREVLFVFRVSAD